MNLTESLKPADDADRKPPVGNSFPEIYATSAKIPPESRGPAMRAVAARAINAYDARSLMEHLGLIDPLTPTPVWQRVRKTKAVS